MRRKPFRPLAPLGFLAAICIYAATCAGAVTEGQVDSLLDKLKRATIDEVWAVQHQLVDLGPDAVPILKSRLPKARPPVQIAVAKALCVLGEPQEAIEPLAALISDKAAPEYAVAAATILGEKPACDVPATERHLLRLAEDHALTPEVARAVAKALGLTATSEESIKVANGALRRLLTAANDPAEQADTALALAEIDDFAPPVEAILKDMEEKPTLRGRLAHVLLENHRLSAILISPKAREGSLNDRLLNEVKARIQKYHVEEPLPDHVLINAAARGMVSALAHGEQPDRHSAYFDEEDWKKFREHITGHYGGIGTVVQFTKHFDSADRPMFTVIRPNYDGPAYKAGLRSYDRIIEVNGQSTEVKDTAAAAKKLKDIVEALRGEPGSPVDVVVTRPGSKETRKVRIMRAEIDVPSVRYQLLPARLGYVRLTSFSDGSARDLDQALRALEKQGMVGLIFDLRDNPGGQLQAAVQITDQFLKDNKLIVYTQGRNETIAPREEFRTKDPTTHPDYPIVVLVNGGSASASEIVAGALQDQHRATLIGETTYGKGSVQKLFPIQATAGQSGLKLTIAKYYLPSGRSIHGKGVQPDIRIPFEPTVTAKDFEHLRENGAFYRYSSTRFAEHKDLLAKLADFDAMDANRYPDFQTWYKAMAEDLGRDKARRLLRAWLRILVADDRGADFVCDFEEDNQLQAAILELAKHFEEIDPKMVPEYRYFPEPKPAEKNGDSVARENQGPEPEDE